MMPKNGIYENMIQTAYFQKIYTACEKRAKKEN